MYRRARWFLAAIGFLVALGIFRVSAHPASANGCSPTPARTPPPSAAERTQAASLVLEGTVISIRNVNENDHVATVQVHKYLKGLGPAVVTISGFSRTWATAHCPDEVREGDHLIFYTYGTPPADLSAYYLQGTGSIAPVSPDILAEITGAAGQDPVTPESPLTPMPPPSITPTTPARITEVPQVTAMASPSITPTTPVPIRENDPGEFIAAIGLFSLLVFAGVLLVFLGVRRSKG